MFASAEPALSAFSVPLKVNNVEESQSVQDAPTLLVSEKGGGPLNAAVNSVVPYPPPKVESSSYNDDAYDNNE